MEPKTRAPNATTLPFLFDSGKERVVAEGVYRRFSEIPEGDSLRELLGEGPTEPGEVHDGSLSSLQESAPPLKPPAVVVGALPFDLRHAPALVQPIHWRRLPGDHWPSTLWGEASSGSFLRRPKLRISGSSSDSYAAQVAEALKIMTASRGSSQAEIAKVVLARHLTVQADRPFDPQAILRHLRQDPHATVFLVPLPTDPERRSLGERFLAGATPELLLERQGLRVRSVPMAGSMSRSFDPEGDRTAADYLLQSEKERREHALVVEHVLDTLSPLCRRLSASPTPEVIGAGSVWHLATPVEGELARPEISSLDLARLLHPTPAVCGVPTEASRRLIAKLEPFSRDFYAGAVGWCDAQGDGRWMVSIRCAEFHGNTATLYAGAGIVEGSDPAAETAETSAKFLALLKALGIREDGSPMDESVL